MNLERGSDGLHLNPRLLTQAHRGELKLVAVSVRLCVDQIVASTPPDR